MQIVKPNTTFDFVGKRRAMAILSVALVGLSLAFVLIGSSIEGFPFAPKYGVDFSGGTEIHLQVQEGVDIGEIRRGLSAIGLSDDNVQSFGTKGNEFLVRVGTMNFGADRFFTEVGDKLKATYGEDAWIRFDWNAEQSVHMTAVAKTHMDEASLLTLLQGMDPSVKVSESKVTHDAFVISYPGITEKVKDQLAAALGGPEAFEVLSVEMVGPAVGAELRRKGVLSLVLSLALILVYVAFRFDLSFAPGAVTALFHDVLITVGVFCIMGREFTLPTIGALLTIVGYSLNDTIVVYDRIRENLDRFPRRDLGEVINISLNETLSRTLLTSVTTLLAVLALMFFGGSIIADFALALLVGVFVGTYSSIFVASPMILTLQKWLPVEVPDTTEQRNLSRAQTQQG